MSSFSPTPSYNLTNMVDIKVPTIDEKTRTYQKLYDDC